VVNQQQKKQAGERGLGWAGWLMREDIGSRVNASLCPFWSARSMDGCEMIQPADRRPFLDDDQQEQEEQREKKAAKSLGQKPTKQQQKTSILKNFC
jgi:hypothetical protein